MAKATAKQDTDLTEPTLPAMVNVAPVKQDVIFVEHQRSKVIPKKVGGEPSPGGRNPDKGAVTFLSAHKNLIIYDGDRMAYHFDNHMFITNNQQDIAFFESAPTFKNCFWKGKFPAEVIRKFDEDKSHTFRDDDIFTNPD